MPIGAYFHGGGNDVMNRMLQEYGPEKGKKIFYATANKRKAKPMAYGGVVDPNDPDYEEAYDAPPPPPPMRAMDQPPPEQGPPVPVQQEAPPPPPPPVRQGPPPPMLNEEPPPMPPQRVSQMPRPPMPPPQVPAPPPKPAPPPPRIQGAATQQYMDEAARVAGEKPKLWQNIAGAIAPRIDFHPNITRDRRNLALYKNRADEERSLQQAQSNEELKNAQLASLEENRQASIATRNADLKPQRTPAEELALWEAAGYGHDQAMQIVAAGGKLQPKQEKALTGPALQVDLLTKQHLADALAKGEDITEDEAHNRALADFAKKYKEGVETARPEEYRKDPNSKTGYSRILRSNKTGEIVKVVPDVEVPNSLLGTVSTQQSVRFVPQADGTIREVPVTSTTTRQRPNAPAQGGAAATPAPSVPGPPAMPTAPSGPQGRIVGATPAETKRVTEAKELSPAGQNQMKEVDVVSRQFDDLLNKLEAYKGDNNPLTLTGPMAKYKMGIKTPEGELGNEISNLSLASIQGMMPFASKSRNYQFIKDIAQHLPHLAIVGGDSPAMIYDKLLKARLNFAKMEAAISRFETKHATASPGPVPLPEGTARLYFRAAGGDPGKARAMAVADGWQP